MIRTDGTIEIELPRVIITPKTSREEFLASPLFAISKPLNQNAPWSRYSFTQITIHGEQFAGDICFCQDAIYSALLCSIRPEFGSREGSSSNQEQTRHCFHKQFLTNIFNRSPDEKISRGSNERDADTTYNFSWGTISAATDMKASGAFIIVKYGE